MTVISPSAVAFNPVTAAALIAGDDGVAILNPPYTAVNATIVHANLHGATAYSLAVNASGTRALVLHEDPVFCTPGFFIDFGNVPVGTTAGPITITCTNEGVGPIQVTAFTIGGTGFALTGQPSVPFTLPPAGSFSFGVTFTPPVVGPQSGFVDVDETIVNTGLTRTEGFGLAGVGVGGPTPTPTIPGPTPTPGPGPSTAIPTLSTWMMAVLGFLLAGLGIFFVTRNRG
jgi:hypothetical protein